MIRLNVLGIVFVWLLASTVLLAQGEGGPPPPPPPPPPAPLIYTAPDTSEIVKFTPEDRNFTADFPGVAKENRFTKSGAVIVSYHQRRKGSNSVVSITNLAQGTDLVSMKDSVFELIRKGIVAEHKATIEKESLVELNGKPGIELEVKEDYIYRIVRVFLVGNRIIEIQSDVTNWHIIGDKTKAEWRKEVARFFDSFVIH